jgi:hypothetical protein
VILVIAHNGYEPPKDCHDTVSKNYQISNSMTKRPVGAELFHAEGRMDGPTGMMKLIVASRYCEGVQYALARS